MALPPLRTTSSPTAQAPSPDVPRFTPLGVLGKGGFATVFCAEDRITGRKVAVKRFSQARFLSSARAEFALLQQLRHANIVRVYCFVHTAVTTADLAMELCGGGELYAALTVKSKELEGAQLQLQLQRTASIFCLVCSIVITAV